MGKGSFFVSLWEHDKDGCRYRHRGVEQHNTQITKRRQEGRH